VNDFLFSLATSRYPEVEGWVEDVIAQLSIKYRYYSGNTLVKRNNQSVSRVSR